LSLPDALELLNGVPLNNEQFTTRVLGSDFSMDTYFQFIQTLGVPK
jgi:hypothetical protein